MADDDWDPTIGQYTASPTLAPDDPLRQWGANLTPEELSHLAAGNDPQVAIDRLIARGVPPPPSQIMAFSDAKGNNIDPTSGMPTQPDGTPFPVFGSNGKLQGNLTDPEAGSKATPSAPVAAISPPAPPAASFDPEETPPAAPSGIPIPRERPAEAGPGASDLSAQKRQKTGDALDGFAKSLAGVKAPTAPPLNAVGTPGAPQHAAVQAPNITQLLSMIGQQQRPSVLQTLGRLLVAGKA